MAQPSFKIILILNPDQFSRMLSFRKYFIPNAILNNSSNDASVLRFFFIFVFFCRGGGGGGGGGGGLQCQVLLVWKMFPSS